MAKQRRRFSAPKLTIPRLVISRTDVQMATPYNPDFLDDFKRRVPFKDRRWEKEKKLWHLTVSKDILVAVIELTQRHYNGAFPEILRNGVTVEEILAEETIDRSTYYAVLEVPEDAETKVIRKAYFKLAKRFHPDAGHDEVEHFHLIQKAYDTLTNPNKRKRYDAALRLMRRVDDRRRRYS